MAGLLKSLDPKVPNKPTSPAVTVAGPKSIADPAKSTDTLEQVNRVIASDSPLMKQAATAGLQQANKRGLLSSSIAVNAAQDAVLTAATPIASQTASQNAAAEQQDKTIRSQVDLQKMQDASALKQISEQGKVQTGLQTQEIAANRAEKALDRQTQVKLAEWNLKASEREQAAGMLTQFQGTYENALNAINSNQNLSPAARTKQITALNARREKQMQLIRSLYDVDISWPANA